MRSCTPATADTISLQEMAKMLAEDSLVVKQNNKVLQAYESIAATFCKSFRHHVGTDPALELNIIKAILRRETTLSRVKAMVGRMQDTIALFESYAPSLPHVSPLRRHSAIMREHSGLLDCLSLLREATAETIEAMILWREGLTQYPPPAFMWEGKNYLLKLFHDLDFLADIQPLVDSLGLVKNKLICNPLMLSAPPAAYHQGMEEDERSTVSGVGGLDMGSEGSRSGWTYGKFQTEQDRLITLSQVAVMEERFESERASLAAAASEQQQQQEQEQGEEEGIYHEESICSQSQEESQSQEMMGEDAHAFRKKMSLFSWYDEAMYQLRRLKRSMAKGKHILENLEKSSLDEDTLLRDGRLYPLATPPPNPALLNTGGQICLPRCIQGPPTALDPEKLRHPLEPDEEGESPSHWPVKFTRELNNALILRASKIKAKPIRRAYVPRRLEKVQARYMEPAKTPMTREEYGSTCRARQTGRAATASSAPSARSKAAAAGAGSQKPRPASSSAAVPAAAAAGVKTASSASLLSASRSGGERERCRRSSKSSTSSSRGSSSNIIQVVEDVAPRQLASILTEVDLDELSNIRDPPKALAIIAATCLILLAPGDEIPWDVTWPAFHKRIKSKKPFLEDVRTFDPQDNCIPTFKIRALQSVITSGPDMYPSSLLETSPGGAKLGAWVIQVLLLQQSFAEKVKSKGNALRRSIHKVLETFTSAAASKQKDGGSNVSGAAGDCTAAATVSNE